MLKSYPLKLQSVALFGSRIFDILAKMRWYGAGGSIFSDQCPYNKGTFGYRDMHIGWAACEHEEKEMSHARTAQEHPRLPATHQKLGDKHISLPDIRGPTTTLVLDSSLQECEMINFCVLSPPSLLVPSIAALAI